MEAFILKTKDVKFHNIVFAYTSPCDYEMYRIILLEDLEGLTFNEYVIAEGYHCSCYGFDDTQWDAIKYTREELIKLANKKIENEDLHFSDYVEKKFYQEILEYI